MPYKTPKDYVLNKDFQNLVAASKLPRTSKFGEQSICFSKSSCKQLLEPEIDKSKIARELSAFDHAVILDGLETNYIIAFANLSSYFASARLITSSDKEKTVSQYRLLGASHQQAGKVDLGMLVDKQEL